MLFLPSIQLIPQELAQVIYFSKHGWLYMQFDLIHLSSSVYTATKAFVTLQNN